MLLRVLPLVPPVRFANILSISSLPPKDFTILNVASLKVPPLAQLSMRKCIP
jgi:hypothetical protein